MHSRDAGAHSELSGEAISFRYSAEELAATESRGENKTDWAAVTAKTEEELAADMASELAWHGVPADWVSRARAATGLMRRRTQNKRQMMRPDADVLAFFKRSGRGWQGRMNAVLRITGQQRQRR